MRKKRNYKREYIPDAKFNSVILARFINYIMEDGKKAVAEKIMYNTFDILEKETKEKPMDVFNRALENVSPIVEVVTKRVGGANYQVPREVRPDRKFTLAARWIIESTRKKSGKAFSKRLAEELIAASKNEGAAIKKKQDTHRMAEANRAFAHFAR